MLTDLGKRLLPWLDEQVLPIAADLIGEFHEYVRAWRDHLNV